jgi:hypothetical protein
MWFTILANKLRQGEARTFRLFALNLFVGQLDDSDASESATEKSPSIEFDDGDAPVVGFV